MLKYILLFVGLTSTNAQTDDFTIITKRIETITIAIPKAPSTLTNETLQSYADILNEAVNKINEAIAKSSNCKTPVSSERMFENMVEKIDTETTTASVSIKNTVATEPPSSNSRENDAEELARIIYKDCGIIDDSVQENSAPWMVSIKNTKNGLIGIGVLIHPLAAFTKYHGFEESNSIVTAGRYKKLVNYILTNGLKDYLLIWETPIIIGKNVMPICIPSSMNFLADCRMATWSDPNKRRGSVVEKIDIVQGEECNGGSSVCATASFCIPGESTIDCALPSSRRVFVGFPYLDVCNNSQVLTVAYPNLNWLYDQGFA